MGSPRNPVVKKGYVEGSKPDVEKSIWDFVEKVKIAVKDKNPKFTTKQALHYISCARQGKGIKGLTFDLIFRIVVKAIRSFDPKRDWYSDDEEDHAHKKERESNPDSDDVKAFYEVLNHFNEKIKW